MIRNLLNDICKYVPMSVLPLLMIKDAMIISTSRFEIIDQTPLKTVINIIDASNRIRYIYTHWAYSNIEDLEDMLDNVHYGFTNGYVIEDKEVDVA